MERTIRHLALQFESELRRFQVGCFEDPERSSEIATLLLFKSSLNGLKNLAQIPSSERTVIAFQGPIKQQRQNKEPIFTLNIS